MSVSGADALDASDWFDHEFYLSVMRISGLGRREAAEHYLRVGARSRMPLNPLHQPHLVPNRIWQAAQAGDVAKLVWWVSTQRGANSLLPFAFDERDDQDVLRAAPRTRQLPMAEDIVRFAKGPTIRWKDYRDRVIRSLSLLGPTDSAKFTTSRWDVDLEAEFLQEIEIAGLRLNQDNSPLVTVVMTARNREHDIADAIRSVIGQSYERWELIVVDDESTDLTRKIVEEFAEQDSRVRLLANPREGISGARNSGLAEAQGVYSAFLDAHNRWRPNYLSLMVAALALRPRATAVCGAIAISRGDGVTIYAGGPVTTADLLVESSIDLNAVLTRTSKLREIGGFNFELKRWVDHDLALKISRQGRLDYVPVIAFDGALEGEAGIWSLEASGCFSRVVESALLDKVASVGFPKPIRKPDVSVVIVGSSRARIGREIERASELFSSESYECIIAMGGATTENIMKEAASVALHPNVTVLPFAANYTEALLANLAVSVANADVVLVINDNYSLRAGSGSVLARKVLEAQTAAVGPLLSRPDGTLISCGREWADGYQVPFRFLPDLSPDDATAEVERPVSGLDVGVISFKREDFQGVGGFDTIFSAAAAWMDLGFRLADAGCGELIVCTDARGVGLPVAQDVSHSPSAPETRILIERHSAKAKKDNTAWLRAGWSMASVQLNDEAGLGVAPVLRRTPAVASDGLKSLRWSIKIGAGYTEAGDRWGDVPYAADLRACLMSLGHNAVVDRFHPRFRRAASPDDVQLVLRGLKPVAPIPGRRNLIWIISHPDMVTSRELDRFDGVFVASTFWAKQLAGNTHVPVMPLLQAARVERFTLEPDQVSESGKALFVGRPRDPDGRRIVHAALQAGLPLEVWGPGWENYIPEEFVGGQHLPNDQLPAKYARASLVLSDHFQDMAREGFVNNRVFEALACGARVVSDPVAGMQEVFGDDVATYNSVEELRWLFDHRHERFGGDCEAQVRRSRIADHHSFATRARQLVEYVRELDLRPPS